MNEQILKRFAVLTAAAGLSVWAIDMAATQVGLPSMQADLGVSVTASQWILNITLDDPGRHRDRGRRAGRPDRPDAHVPHGDHRHHRRCSHHLWRRADEFLPHRPGGSRPGRVGRGVLPARLDRAAAGRLPAGRTRRSAGQDDDDQHVHHRLRSHPDWRHHSGCLLALCLPADDSCRRCRLVSGGQGQV